MTATNYIVECEWKTKPGKWSGVGRHQTLECAKEEANEYQDFINSGEMAWSGVRIVREDVTHTVVQP